MEKKWKVYYVCSLYLLIWVGANLAALVYLLTLKSTSIENPAVSIPAILIVLACIATKAFLSLRFTTLLKTGGTFTEREKWLFNFSRRILLFLSAASAIAIAAELPEDFKKIRYMGNIDIIQTSCLFAATASAVFCSFIDSLLIKTIRRQHDDSIETIGQHIQP